MKDNKTIETLNTALLYTILFNIVDGYAKTIMAGMAFAFFVLMILTTFKKEPKQ